MDSNERWCMDFSNDEIKKFLIGKIKERTDVRYIVNDEYVNEDCKEDFEYVIFDGTKQEFYVSFTKSQTSLFFHNQEIMFIDDNEKKYYTSSDVDDCIVYEGRLREKSHEQILELIVELINLLKDATNIRIIVEKSISKTINSYAKKHYSINIDNIGCKSGKYEFENIIVNVS